MSARIFQPSRPATQSGNAKSQGWVLEFYPEMSSKIDPLMGWTSSGEMQAQVKLNFPDKESAVKYANKHGIDAIIVDSKKRKPIIRSGGYAENFDTNRKVVWTH
jgi:hypothetical protein